MEALTRNVWQGLSAQDKQDWMKRIELMLPEGMQYEGLETFERFGQRTETGCLHMKRSGLYLFRVIG